MSLTTAFAFIAEGSEATPGLWNRMASQLSDNIGSINAGLIPPSVLSGSTWASIGLQANSNNSDYIRMADSSGARSTYIIGSHAGGTADGLNIYDESGQTMLASFSKQSIRFYQNVVGPVFDVGGALASTLNAGTFGSGGDSKESRIQAAISAATAQGIARVYVPANMYPYSAGSISFATTVQMVREGGDWSAYDLKAYGATGDGTADDRPALHAIANMGIPEGGGTLYAPGPGTYKIGSTTTIPPTVFFGPAPGATFQIESAATLVIRGRVVAQDDQNIFAGAGKVSIGTGTGTVVPVRWFGAKGDNITNDQTALWRATDALEASGGGVLRFGAGVFIGSVSVYTSNMVVEGAGESVCTIKAPSASYRSVSDASMTINSTLLGSATAAFTSSDVSKTVFVDAAEVASNDLIAIISQISSSTQAILDRAAGATATGKMCRIGVGRNVIEFGRTYLGNNSSAMTGVGLRNISLDGNRSGISGPAEAGDDLVLHGAIFTNCRKVTVDGVRSSFCHNTGVDLAILSDRAWVRASVDSCGNSVTGMPGFDMNSSSYGHVAVTVANSYQGARILDNCHGNEAEFVTRGSDTYGFVMNNQSVGNMSIGNHVVVTSTEDDATGNAGAIAIGSFCRNNIYDLNVQYAGCAFAISAGTDIVTANYPSYGVRIGDPSKTDLQKPRGNHFRIAARRNGAEGAIIEGNQNSFDIVASENGQKTAATYYGVDVTGSRNNVRASFDDQAAQQLGLRVRIVSGDSGTPGSGNVLQIPVPNPSTPLTDSGTSTYYMVPGQTSKFSILDVFNLSGASIKAAGQTTAIKIGNDAANGYGIVSVNGSLADSGSVGIMGSGADSNLYLNTTGAGTVSVRVDGTVGPTLSAGVLNVNSARLVSIRTVGASAITLSAVQGVMSVNEAIFSIGGASGASLLIYSAGSVYIFNSSASAKAT